MNERPVVPAQSEPDVVHLEFPPSPRFLAAARLVATSLGADVGLSVDDLDDLRLGVNELVTALLDGSGPTSRIALEFAPNQDAITVTGRIQGDDGAAVADELTRRILEAVADHYEVGTNGFVLTKASSLREQS